MPNLSQSTEKLITRYQFWYKSLQPAENITTIHVDEVASKVAAFYEKIRGIIDWKEEHLLKRRAIERILKRRIFSKLLSEGVISSSVIAEPLVLELIRGGHFLNDQIPESKINEVQKTIDKYVFIVNNTSYNRKKSKIQLYSWISGIAACEIKEILSPSIKERALINYMFEVINPKIETDQKIKITGQEKNTQTYIAVQRALFNLDSPIISYHLLKYHYSEWENFDLEQLKTITKNIHIIKNSLEKDLNHPLEDKFYNICEKYDTPFLLLGDVLSKNPMEAKEKISNPELLEVSVIAHYNQRVKTLKKRLGRAAFYSTLSIFLTNIVSLFIIEMPFNKWVTGYFFNYWAITIDIIGPTLLMFLLVITIRPPKKENLPRVLMEVMKIVYDKGKKDVYKIKRFKKRNIVFEAIINFFYLLGFGAILFLVIWSLYRLNFPPLSHVIFIVFLSLIAFAGTKIRQRAKELQVIEEKETLLHFFVDPFAVPIIQLGKWLTAKWTRYNVVAVFFSALIDMPFTIFVEFIEQWRYFLKEKKEKIH